MNLDDKIRRADDLLFEVLHDFSLFDAINPTNSLAERERFMEAWEAGKEYNPLFAYAAVPEDLHRSLKALRELDFDSSALHVSFHATRDEWAQTLELAAVHGTPEVTAKSAAIFGHPSEDLVEEARRMLKGSRPAVERESPEIGIKVLSDRFRYRFREDRVEGWDVVEDPQAVGLALVDFARHKIHLQSGLLISRAMAERLLHHEVGVHVYRSANGERQPLKAFGIGLAGHLRTEEGLALELEERMNLTTIPMKRRYAGRVIASSLALKKSFFDIFAELVEFFPPEEAFTLVQRSKRGLQDTSKPGGFIQDHLYLHGRQEVKNLTLTQFQLLYTGRVSVAHLPLIREMMKSDLLLEPVFLPRSFHG